LAQVVGSSNLGVSNYPTSSHKKHEHTRFAPRVVCAAGDNVRRASGAVVGQHQAASDPGLKNPSGRLIRKEDNMIAAVGSDGHVAYDDDYMVDFGQGDEPDDNTSFFDAGVDSDDDFDLFPNSSLLEDNETDDEAMGLNCPATERLSGNTDSKRTGDSSIVGSSYWANRGDHGKGQMWRTRLNNAGTTWCAAHNRVNQWVQWDFGSDKLVTRSLLMGRRNCCRQWVTQYRLYYRASSGGWKWHPQTLSGNWNENSLRTNTLAPQIIARYVRIYVKKWHGHISMRADFDGCAKPAKPVPGPRGAAGPRGASGPRGAAGARGPPGARGAKGDTPKPVDCVWAEWADYSECTKTCGAGAEAGSQVRSRSYKIQPQNGGKDCEGLLFETKKCNEKACPTTTTTTTTTTKGKSKSSSVPLSPNCLTSIVLLAVASIPVLS